MTRKVMASDIAAPAACPDRMSAWRVSFLPSATKAVCLAGTGTAASASASASASARRCYIISVADDKHSYVTEAYKGWSVAPFEVPSRSFHALASPACPAPFLDLPCPSPGSSRCAPSPSATRSYRPEPLQSMPPCPDMPGWRDGSGAHLHHPPHPHGVRT